MNRVADFQKGVEFINYRRTRSANQPARIAVGNRCQAIAMSRQSASGAHAVAEKLALYLQPHLPLGAPRWAVFDRNLVEKVLEDHHLPERLAKFMPEDAISHIDDILDDLFGLHPSSEILVRRTSETILRLAKLGQVILLGRAAAVVTANLPHVFRVRLVAPLEKRIQFMQETEKLERRDAEERVEEEDHAHRRYFKKYFHKDPEDPLLYHMVVNTGEMSLDEATRIIGDQVIQRMAVTPVRKAA